MKIFVEAELDSVDTVVVPLSNGDVLVITAKSRTNGTDEEHDTVKKG